MKFAHQGSRPYRQVGRSIVELMIALTIGMVIIIAVTSLFVANNKTFKATDDNSQLEQEGRLALNLMAYHIRMAGFGNLISAKETALSTSASVTESSPVTYTTFDPTSGAGTTAIFGCRYGFTNTATASPTCVATAGTPDSFLVRYVVDDNSATVDASNIPTDCLGVGLTASPALTKDDAKEKAGEAAYYVVENRFYIATVSGVPSLYCRGNGGTSVGADLANVGQPIAENVEDLKITYGVSNAGGQAIDRYLTANAVTNWQQVISVKLCMVVRSANDNISTAAQQYVNCTGTAVTATDRRLRKVFSTVVTIRSRAIGAT